MAWSAPSDWDRWGPDKLLVCPFNQEHRVHTRRYQYHVIKCRENYPERDFVSCPFNAKHIMLRTELRKHLARCQDRGEIEPYTYKGIEKDSEGFYFKGDTSVPCYKKETTTAGQEEDWDREDEETTSQQNLCEYYARLASLPARGEPDVQDVLSLNSTDREEFKRKMRTRAIQSQHQGNNQQNPPGQPSLRHGNHVDEESLRERNWKMDIGREACNSREGSSSQTECFQSQSNHCNEKSDEQIGRFSPGNKCNQGYAVGGQTMDRMSDNVLPYRTCNSFLPAGHQGSDDNCIDSGTTYSFQDNSHSNTMDSSDHIRGVSMLEMTGVNSAERPSLKGAGRARLAEEARRMNFAGHQGSDDNSIDSGTTYSFQDNSHSNTMDSSDHIRGVSRLEMTGVNSAERPSLKGAG